MTSLATKPSPSALSERMVAAWNTFATRSNPVVVIVAAWAVLTAATLFRSDNSAEGLAVSVAGMAIAGAGSVGHIIAHLPIALALLSGCLLIYWLLRKIAASVPAALFGAALFLACPLVIHSSVAITAELPLAVLLFLAFCLWWGGKASGSISTGRCLAIAVVLALTVLLKGPQPASPTMFSAGPFGADLRILGDALPAVLAAAGYLLARGYGVDGAPGAGFVRPAFIVAAACYALAGAIFVLLWPGGMTPRYYFPMLLPLCVFGGLGYDLFSARRPQLVAPLLLLTAGLLVYALLYSVGLAG
jgi:hypothetical protein